MVVVWRTHRGGLMPRVYNEPSDKNLDDLQVVCSEAVQFWGRRPGIHNCCFRKQCLRQISSANCCTLSPKRVSSRSLETPTLDQAQIPYMGQGVQGTNFSILSYPPRMFRNLDGPFHYSAPNLLEKASGLWHGFGQSAARIVV